MSKIWRMVGLDTDHRDLILSSIGLYTGASKLTGAVVASSHEPVMGVLADVEAGVPGAVCAFSARDVASPGFHIQWAFSEDMDPWCVRMAGPDPLSLARNYALGYQNQAGQWVWSQHGRVATPAAGALTLATSSYPVFGVPLGWRVQTGVSIASLGFAGCSLSSTGQSAIAAGYGTGAKVSLSADGGLNWTVATGPVPDANGFYGAAVSRDGRTMLVTGVGSTAAKVSISKDGGATWSVAAGLAVGSVGFAGCAVSADGLHMAVAGYGSSSARINVSHDAGVTWTQPTGPVADSSGFIGVAISDDGQTIAATGVGSAASRFSISKDGGVTWSVAAGLAVGGSGFAGCAVSADGSHMTVAGYGTSTAKINVSHDAGATWTQPTGPVADSAGFIGVAISDDGQTIAAAAYGSSASRLSLSRDGGSTWSAPAGQPIPPSGYIWCALSSDGRLLLAAQSGSSAANIAQLLVADKSYQGPDLGMQALRLWARPGEALSEQGDAAMTRIGADFVLDREFSGLGTIYGVVRDDKTKQTLQRRVRLHRSRDGMLVRETWSKADGSYRFSEINERYEYDIEAWDHEKNSFTTVANNQLPEVRA